MTINKRPSGGGGGGSDVTPSPNNGKLIVNSQEITVFDDSVITAQLSDKASAAQLANKSDAGHKHALADITDWTPPGEGSVPLELGKQAVSGNTQFSQTPPTRTALVTFIDDDAKVQVLTKVQNLVESKNIPYAIAVPVNDINNQAGRSLTQAELLHLQDDLGCEIVGHTYTHPTLSNMTEKQLEVELGESKKILVSKGYNIKGIAYPFGANNTLVRKVAARYYDWGVNTLGSTNSYPLRTYQIQRISIGSYTSGNNTLAYYKSKVDEAVTNKGWVIFVSHVWNTAEHDAAQEQIISDLIDYIKSINVPIVNPSVGWEMFGNVLEVETKVRITNAGETIVDNSTEYKTYRDSSRLPDALITDYPNQTIILAEYSNANKGTLPQAGVLETRRVPNATDYTYSTQFLYGISGSIYTRKPTAYNNATWAAWKTVFNAT